MFNRKQVLPSIVRSLLLIYFSISLPILLIFVKSEYVRFVNLETVAHWCTYIRPPEYVFIGDSITAGGRNWGIRLRGNPIISRNLACSGYTTRQIANQASRALEYSPNYVVVMAGTNDILTGRSSEGMINDYKQLLETFRETSTRPIVTLVPHQKASTYKKETQKLNRAIRALAVEHGVEVIDLNPIIAPRGRLLPEFTTDGVHLSEAAYNVWRDAISELLRAGS